MPERAFEFYSAATDIARACVDEDGRVGRDLSGRFVDHGLPHPHFAGHDRALRLFAAWKKTAIDQENIEPRLSRLGHLSHCAAYNRSIIATDCISSPEPVRRCSVRKLTAFH